MSSPRRPRLIPELAFAYLLPLPALVAGLWWSLVFTAMSWTLAWAGDFAILVEGTTQPTPLIVVMTVASLMLGMLPAIIRLSSAAEYWDFHEGRPMQARRRWRMEKQGLANQGREAKTALANILGALGGILLAGGLLLEWDWPLLASPTLAWASLQMVGLILLLVRGVALNKETARIRRHQVEAATEVDLLDLSPQYRAARFAMRGAMTWLAGGSLSSLFLFAGGDAGETLTVSILLVVTLFASASLLPPLLLVQGHIRKAKREELQRLRAEVLPLRDRVLAGEEERGGHLADLLSYLHYVETLPELPFDKGKAATWSLYFAVPLGSWLWISGLQMLLGLFATA